MKSHRPSPAQEVAGPTATQGPSTQQSTSDNSLLLEQLAQASQTGADPLLQDGSRGFTTDDMHAGSGDSQRYGVLESSLVRTKSNDPSSEYSLSGDNKAWDVMKADPTLGFTLSGDKVNIGYAGEQKNANQPALLKKTGIDTIAGYKGMLTKDFDFGGVVGKYGAEGTGEERKARGEASFVEDVVARYFKGEELDGENAQACREIARNIWSYATVGADCHGETNIAEMQGLLYVFDKQIKRSSDTNTPMDEEHSFVVPGTEDWETPIRVLRGDDRHGQATILTTRHLLASMTEEPTIDESYLLIDKSSSMRMDEFGHLSKTIEAGGIEGQIGMAAFDAGPDTLDLVKAGRPMAPHVAAQILDEASKSRATTDYLRMSDEQKKHITDSSHLTIPSGKATEEHGIDSALAWLNSPLMSQPTDQHRQLMVVTDEPDMDPACLDELQEAAIERGVEIKVMISYTKRDPGYAGLDDDSYRIVDLMELDPASLPDFEVESGPHEGHLDWRAVGVDQGAPQKKW